MNETDSDVGERAPFLRSTELSNHVEDSSSLVSRRVWVTLCIAALTITMDFPVTLARGPQLRLYEAIYCADWYKQNDRSYLGYDGLVEEQYCKIVSVQASVSSLVGWMGLFDNLPGYSPLPRFEESLKTRKLALTHAYSLSLDLARILIHTVAHSSPISGFINS